MTLLAGVDVGMAKLTGSRSLLGLAGHVDLQGKGSTATGAECSMAISASPTALEADPHVYAAPELLKGEPCDEGADVFRRAHGLPLLTWTVSTSLVATSHLQTLVWAEDGAHIRDGPDIRLAL